MQIFSIDTQWHLVHPWHQNPLKTCDEGGTQKLISVVLAWSLGRCTDGFCPAAAAAGCRMKRSEVQGRLTAEVGESALLRWGELWRKQSRNGDIIKSRASEYPHLWVVQAALAPCPGLTSTFNSPPKVPCSTKRASCLKTSSHTGRGRAAGGGGSLC